MTGYLRRTPTEETAHRRGNLLASVVVALSLTSLALAIAILVIQTNHLMLNGDCLFTTASQSVNVCQLSRARLCCHLLYCPHLSLEERSRALAAHSPPAHRLPRSYGLAVCIISFLCSIIMVFALCRPPLAIGAVSAFGTLWWLGYAITVSVYNHSAADAGLPNQHDRNSVIGMSWACFVCMLLIFGLAAHLYRVKWEPEEIGRGPADEFDRFVQFKAREAASKQPIPV